MNPTPTDPLSPNIPCGRRPSQKGDVHVESQAVQCHGLSRRFVRTASVADLGFIGYSPVLQRIVVLDLTAGLSLYVTVVGTFVALRVGEQRATYW